MRRIILSTFTGLLALATLAPAPTEAHTFDGRHAPGWVRDLTYAAAARHGANAPRMLAVIDCETGGTFDPAARNPNGLDHGIAQFRIHAGGYSLIQETPYARPGADTWRAVYDPARAIGAMAYVWGEWPGTTGADHWSCYRLLYR